MYIRNIGLYRALFKRPQNALIFVAFVQYFLCLRINSFYKWLLGWSHERPALLSRSVIPYKSISQKREQSQEPSWSSPTWIKCIYFKLGKWALKWEDSAKAKMAMLWPFPHPVPATFGDSECTAQKLELGITVPRRRKTSRKWWHRKTFQRVR